MGSLVGLTNALDDSVVEHMLPFLHFEEGFDAAKAVLAPKPQTFRAEIHGDFYYIHGDWNAFMQQYRHIIAHSRSVYI